MKITICNGCSEVVSPAIIVHESHVYCADCARVHGLDVPRMCTKCNRNVATFEPRQQPLSPSHCTYLCTDCFDNICFDHIDVEAIESEWQQIDV